MHLSISDIQIEPCDKDSISVILDGLNTYNLNKVPAVIEKIWTPIELQVINAKKEVVGGLLSGIGYWGGLEIKILWVHEDYRSLGIGSQLMDKAEQNAVQKGATIAILDTFDFQAKDFYLKKGYDIIGQLDNFPEGHQRIFFSKKLIEIVDND
ncbi:GNAT family N-acetyltransferase [Aquimarina sp. 2201CG14-23]|uniref:GNAT family N-acetyltransferase n=1 Tax=Aquimarina mycalae TaxID=3040073 RepID=UPI002477DDDE|nr:GNAT family N-acetyltransferase [Aquimarina sp. 2201CG14-23]MDH7444330.1 GNAT family N-acetyltransferase [Aquimarina sp. 2201CG14-23]